MSKSDAFENDFLKLTFQGVAIAGLADNAASAPATSLYLALHTADPGEAGNQGTSEVAYAGYARLAVPRSAGGFVVSGNAVGLVAEAVFATPGAGVSIGTAPFATVGTAPSGTGKVLYRMALTPAIVIGPNVVLRIPSMAVTED